MKSTKSKQMMGTLSSREKGVMGVIVAVIHTEVTWFSTELDSRNFSKKRALDLN
jgi:hypothetical protein